MSTGDGPNVFFSLRALNDVQHDLLWSSSGIELKSDFENDLSRSSVFYRSRREIQDAV